MRQFEIKQKMWSLGGRFTISDEEGQAAYQVEGSFFTIPKTFAVFDMGGSLVSTITKKVFSLFPGFTVELADGTEFFIQKRFSFFKPRYSIESLGLEVQGDLWDMNFVLSRGGEDIARIDQKWFSWTSTYMVTVYEEAYTDLVISLVIAIDYVKEMENSRDK